MSPRSDDAADLPLSTQPLGTLVAASLVIDGVSGLFLSSCLNRNHKRRGSRRFYEGFLLQFDLQFRCTGSRYFHSDARRVGIGILGGDFDGCRWHIRGIINRT